MERRIQFQKEKKNRKYPNHFINYVTIISMTLFKYRCLYANTVCTNNMVNVKQMFYFLNNTLGNRVGLNVCELSYSPREYACLTFKPTMAVLHSI